MHTPAPWLVINDRLSSIIHDSHSNPIARTFTAFVDDEQANARLIGQAPALLDALEELVAEWDAKCKAYTEEHPMCFLADTGGIVFARQVIKLVKGESAS